MGLDGADICVVCTDVSFGLVRTSNTKIVRYKPHTTAHGNLFQLRGTHADGALLWGRRRFGRVSQMHPKKECRHGAGGVPHRNTLSVSKRRILLVPTWVHDIRSAQRTCACSPHAWGSIVDHWVNLHMSFNNADISCSVRRGLSFSLSFLSMASFFLYIPGLKSLNDL